MLQFKKIGFYIGREGIRAVEIKGNGKPAILNVWKSDEPLDLNDTDALKEGLRRAVSESGVSARKVSISIPDTIARTAVLDFEELPESKKDLLEIVRARAARELDVDPGGSAVAFQVLPLGARKKVLCVVAKRSLIEALEDGTCTSGRRISRISLHSLNMVNLLTVDGEDVSVVMRLSDYLAVLIFRAGILDFYRCKVIGDEAEVKRELASTFVFYCGKNPEHRISRVLLFDGIGNLKECIKDLVPARVELPGPISLLLESPAITGKDLSPLAAAGSCI